MRGCEVQDGVHRDDHVGRGALHDHVLARTAYGIDVHLVRRLAINAGFGHSVQVDDVAPGSDREAQYISKYITKSTDSRRDVPWREQVVNVETGEVTDRLVPGRYRTWSCSRRWGKTMAEVRHEGMLYAIERERLRDLEEPPDMSEFLRRLSGELILPGESPPMPE